MTLKTTGPLTEISTRDLLQSVRLRSERDPLRFFRPASPEQAQALRCESKGCLVLGGNRSGKTQAGAVETVGRAIARHPFKPTRRARRIWCVSQELPGGNDKPHTQVEAIRRWMPLEALRGESWARAYSPAARTLTMANGCRIEFKSYDQDLLAFESAAVDWVWFDEEPTRREIYNSCLLRLVDRRGAWMMTLTPVLSLEGKGWVEDLWERRVEAARADEYEVHQLSTASNVHLPQEEVERTAQALTDEERAVRLHGAFARLGGRVLNEFDPTRHLVADFIPSRLWRHVLVIDPGWRTSAHLFGAVDGNGRIWLYAELYEHEKRPDQLVPVLDAIYTCFGRPGDIEVYMDPAGFSLKRTSSGREAPADAEEYYAAASVLGAEWLYPQPADNGDPYAWRVKRYLQTDMLRVCRSLRWWQWEQERWVRQRERQGVAAQERPEPDKPIDRYNHLMDATRYMVNLLPDPEPVPDVPPTALEQHWSRFREAERGSRRRPFGRGYEDEFEEVE